MNLEGGRRGEAIVAAAGPLSNLVLAAIGGDPAPLPDREPGALDAGPGILVTRSLTSSSRSTSC